MLCSCVIYEWKMGRRFKGPLFRVCVLFIEAVVWLLFIEQLDGKGRHSHAVLTSRCHRFLSFHTPCHTRRLWLLGWGKSKDEDFT